MYVGIETSSLVSSVALLHEEKLLGEITIQAGLTHSEQLVPHLEQLFHMTGIKKTEIEGIAVSIGPGSFTGLRIGLGTAKALAFAWQKPLLGVKTTEVLAYNYPYEQRLLAVLIDAQKNNVYEALYTFKNKELIVVQEPMVKNRDLVLDELASRHEPVIFLGDGVSLMKAAIEEKSSLFVVAPSTHIIPRAGSLLLASEALWKINEINNSMDVLPYYIRKSEAEVLWEQRQAKLHEG